MQENKSASEDRLLGVACHFNTIVRHRIVATSRVIHKQKLETPHYKFQQRLLGITWKDKV